MMESNIKVTAPIILLLFIAIIMPGCVTDKEAEKEKTIWSIESYIPTNSSDTDEINVNYSIEQLKNEGYIAKLYLQNNTTNSPRGIHLNRNNTEITIFISLESNSPYIKYHKYKSIEESKLDKEKERIKSEVKNVANICNITTYWDQAQWEYEYTD